MASRRYASSEVSDRYETRREPPRSEMGRRDDRGWEDEVEYRSRPPPRDRERGTVFKEEVRVNDRAPLDFLREDHGRASAGPMVLRAKEREDFEFAPRPRRRSPSPEPRVEREEIIVKREADGRREARPPPGDYERDEILIRRGQREAERERFRPPPPPSREVERDEYIIRKDDWGSNSRYSSGYERDESVARHPPPRSNYEREEIIVRRDREESREPPRFRGREDVHAPSRAISHERERSHMGRSRAGSETDEIIIRRDEIDGGRHGRDREREEIIIRRTGSRSPSPTPTRAPSVRPPPEPPVIKAPPIHQEVITHHRHIDHGYEVALSSAAAPRNRPPTPPTPPREDDERIEIHRRGERNGRSYDEDIIIDRNQSRSAPPVRDRRDEIDSSHSRRPGPPPDKWQDSRDSREIQEEAEYYNQRALERSYPGEGYHGSTRDWAIVDVPPGTSRVRMDGAGGGAQEITWQGYNGVRRSKFMPDASDEGYGSEVGRPAPSQGGEIGRRYGGVKDPREGLWTEMTKDLVVKEAIKEAGYEFEETEDFFYIIAFLKYEDVSRLVGLSEDIRHDRRKRLKEIDWERRALPEPESPRRHLAIENGPSRPAAAPWDREQERWVEREWYRPRPPPYRR